MRKCRQFEWELRDDLPRMAAFTQSSGQCQSGQNGNGKRSVFAVAPLDRFGQYGGVEISGLSGKPLFSGSYSLGVAVIRSRKCGPAKSRGADVADAERRVAPAAVGILMLCQPAASVVDKPVERIITPRRLSAKVECADGGCGRERAAGEAADPMIVVRPLPQQNVAGVHKCLFEQVNVEIHRLKCPSVSRP